MHFKILAADMFKQRCQFSAVQSLKQVSNLSYFVVLVDLLQVDDLAVPFFWLPPSSRHTW